MLFNGREVADSLIVADLARGGPCFSKLFSLETFSTTSTDLSPNTNPSPRGFNHANSSPLINFHT
jgi:hypothetical protein